MSRWAANEVPNSRNYIKNVGKKIIIFANTLMLEPKKFLTHDLKKISWTKQVVSFRFKFSSVFFLKKERIKDLIN